MNNYKTLQKVVASIVLAGVSLFFVFKCTAQPTGTFRTMVSASRPNSPPDSMVNRHTVRDLVNSTFYWNPLSPAAGIATTAGALYWNAQSGKWRIYSQPIFSGLPPDPDHPYDSTKWFDLVLAGGSGGGGFTAPRVPFATGSPATLTDKATFTFNSVTNQLGGGMNIYGTPNATQAGISAGSFAGNPSAPGEGGLWVNSSTATFNLRVNGANRSILPMTLGGLADNSIPYISGNVAIGAPSTFVFDGTNLIIGKNTSFQVGQATSLIQVAATTGAAGSSMARFSANAGGPLISYGKSRGATVGDYTIVQSGDVLGTLDFVGSNGTDIQSRAAEIIASVDGTPGAADMPGKLSFRTSADGSNTPVERFTIDNAGLSVFTERLTTTQINNRAAITIGGSAGDPSSFVNGDMWYNNTLGALKARYNSATVAIPSIPSAGITANRIPFAANTTGYTEDSDLTFTGGNTLNVSSAGANTLAITNASMTAAVTFGFNVTGNITHTVSGDFDLSGTTGNNLKFNRTITAGGTTGAQTINKSAGCVNFAAGTATLVVTNSLATTTSIIFGTVQTNDATALLKNIIPAAGSFTLRLNANATAETQVCFLVTN